MTLLTFLFLLLQMLSVSFLGVQGMMRQLVASAGLRLEVLESAQEADIQTFYATARALPYIEGIAYIPRAQALEQERSRDSDLVAFLEQYKLENPFPDTFAVTLRSLDDYALFRAFIEEDRWHTVINPSFLSAVTDQEQDVRRMLQTAQLLKSVIFLFVMVAVVILLVAVVELVSQSIARSRDEITLEHLLGAQPLSVLLPLMSRTTVWLCIALVLGSCFTLLLIAALPFLVPAMAAAALPELLEVLWPQLRSIFPVVVLLELLLVPVIAAAGTVLGSRGTSVWTSMQRGHW